MRCRPTQMCFTVLLILAAGCKNAPTDHSSEQSTTSQPAGEVVFSNMAAARAIRFEANSFGGMHGRYPTSVGEALELAERKGFADYFPPGTASGQIWKVIWNPQCNQAETEPLFWLLPTENSSCFAIFPNGNMVWTKIKHIENPETKSE